MTPRRSVPTSLRNTIISDDDWTSIEQSCHISFSAEQRFALQIAFNKLQLEHALDVAAPSPSTIKTVLLDLGGNLKKSRAILRRLLSREPDQRAALYEIREQSVSIKIARPERKQIVALCGQLQFLEYMASKAADGLPMAARGRKSTNRIREFFEAADGIFVAANGRKKLRLEYLKAVGKAVGHMPPVSDETLKRMPDKARLQKRAKR